MNNDEHVGASAIAAAHQRRASGGPIGIVVPVIFGAILALCIKDTADLQESLSFPTPWYSTNWLLYPVTNLYLAFHDSREYITTNALKTERWRVREVKVGNALFWTRLDSQPL